MGAHRYNDEMRVHLGRPGHSNERFHFPFGVIKYPNVLLLKHRLFGILAVDDKHVFFVVPLDARY
jgi:hypothetical protein